MGNVMLLIRCTCSRKVYTVGVHLVLCVGGTYLVCGVSCSTLYSECCIVGGGWCFIIAGTASVDSFMECPHC